MTNVRELIQQLEACDGLEAGSIQKMAEEAVEKNAGSIAGRIGAYIRNSPVAQYIHRGLTSPQASKAQGTAALATVGVAAATGIATLVKAYDEIKYHKAVAELRKDPQIADDLPKALSLAKMIKRWAPSIAADPQILGGTVKSLMKFPDSYLTYDIAAKLSDAQKRYADTHGIFSVIKERVF